MGHIPEGATHWDSGDWIEWHRTETGLDERPCIIAVNEEPMARLAALHLNLSRAAKAHFQLTGHHLPVYGELARAYAAVSCDLPLEGPDRCCTTTGVEIRHLAPHCADDLVHVDLTKDFATLIVVRINDNFICEARMIPRKMLPENHEGSYPVSWQSLPHKL